MSNRLLINIANICEWLKQRNERKEFYKMVVKYLDEASEILKPAVESLRGKDIHVTDQIIDEDGVLVTLNEMIDHIDYIINKDGLLVTTTLKQMRLNLDLARQTMRLKSASIPEIRRNLHKIEYNMELVLLEESDNVNLQTACARIKGTIYDLSNV